MFFWLVLASLMGLITFGNLFEKTKPQEHYIAPVYEAMVLNMYQQHISAEYGYLDIMRDKPEEAKEYFAQMNDGIVPLAVADSFGLKPENDNNNVFPYIQGRIPDTYKPQSGTRTYMFCIDKNQVAKTSCGTSDTVNYLMTIRAIPPRYDGADKMTALKVLSEAVGRTRSVGLLEKSKAPLTTTTNSSGNVETYHQPLGATHFILSSGLAASNSVYIPNYLICNFPVGNDQTLGETLATKHYMVALTLLSGLEDGENLSLGTITCPATTIEE